MLDRFIASLRATPPHAREEREMATLLREVCIAGIGLKRPLAVRAGGYTRTCAYLDDDFEVLLLNWSTGAASPIHDHGGQRCWMAVLTGQLMVDDYARLD